MAAVLLHPIHGATESAPAARKAAHIVFLVSSPDDPNSYESARTIPPFAEALQRRHGYRTTVLQATMPESASRFPNIQAIWEADLLVVFCRRLGLPPDQLTTIKNHLKAGKPLVGLRTANHGFAVRGNFIAGHFGWYGFVADILGVENRGYAPLEPGTRVEVVPTARNHPILRGIPDRWHSKGNLYLHGPLLDRRATVLLVGTADSAAEPLAWTRMAGESRVFYTSLGHPADFDDPQPYFRSLLVNGIRWALGEN